MNFRVPGLFRLGGFIPVTPSRPLNSVLSLEIHSLWQYMCDRAKRISGLDDLECLIMRERMEVRRKGELLACADIVYQERGVMVKPADVERLRQLVRTYRHARHITDIIH